MIGAGFAVLSFVLIWLPSVVASWWTLWSSEPFFIWLGKHNFPTVAVSPLWITTPLGGGMLCAILWALFSSTKASEKKKNDGLMKPKEPQPVIVAIDELKAFVSEGEILVNRFQLDSVKPTFGEVENWRKRMRDCARQKVLENFVRPGDLASLDERWDHGEVLEITAEFLDHGCFADGSTEMAVFQSLWGSVKRLKELIAKIEGKETYQDKNSNEILY